MGVLFGKQNWKIVITVWLLILGLVTGVQLVEENLDNRSKAEVKLDFECKVGVLVWTDEEALDGEYNWICIDDKNNVVEEHSLKREEN
jgi:hypothetical protein